MVQKVPPPPMLTDPQWQAVNRWLLEIQNILNPSGAIDPANVQGLTETEAQVVTNTADIASLEATQGAQGGQIAFLQSQVALNTASIATINGQITTLSARNQVFNGTVAPVTLHANGDYYVDTSAKHLYVQVASAWVLIV